MVLVDMEDVLVPGSDENCGCYGRRSPHQHERGRRPSVPPSSHHHNHRDHHHRHLHARGPVFSPFEPHDHNGHLGGPPPPPPPADDFLGMIVHHRGGHDRHFHGHGQHPFGRHSFGTNADDFLGMIAHHRGGERRHGRGHHPFGPPPFVRSQFGGFWGPHHHHPHNDHVCMHMNTQGDIVGPGGPPIDSTDPKSATEGEALKASPSRNPRGNGQNCSHVDCAVPDDVTDLLPPSDPENVDPSILEQRQRYLHHMRPHHHVHLMKHHGHRGFLRGAQMLHLHPGFGGPGEAMWNWPGCTDEDVVLRHRHHAHMKKLMKRCAKRCTSLSASRASRGRCQSHWDTQTRTRSRRRNGLAAPETLANDPVNQADPPITQAVEETEEALGLMAINEIDPNVDPKI